MPRIFHNFTRLHGFIAGGLLVSFMALTLLFCLKGWIPNPGAGRIAVATAATVTGPFTGPIARYDVQIIQGSLFKPCAISATYLLILFLCQVLPLPFQRGARSVRIAAWAIGLFVWFGAGIISLLIAID